MQNDRISAHNTGSIFKNDRKGDNEKAPDYKGKINVNGTMWEIALWLKTGNKEKYFSVAVSEPYVKDAPKEEPHREEPTNDLPF